MVTHESRLDLLGFVFCCALWACSGESPSRTEVVVVVNSNLSVPAELDALQISARSPQGTTKSATAALNVPADLPGSVGLMHPGGELGPFYVLVEGKLGGEVVLTREAEFSFINGNTRRLTMNLLRSCLGVMCPEGQTCTELGCASRKVPESALTPWDGTNGDVPEGGMPLDGGTKPGKDGSTPFSDARVPADSGSTQTGDAQVTDAQVDPTCMPSAETCNDQDDDCDKRVDETFDLQNDETRCGSCTNVCALDNATDMCAVGKCVISQCTSGFADCDNSDTTGCEADLNSDATCGGCLTKCAGQKHCCKGVCKATCP